MRRTDTLRHGIDDGPPGRLGRAWLRDHTIPAVRGLAKDLAARGEDVEDLQAAVEDLDRLVESLGGLEASERRGRVDVPA